MTFLVTAAAGVVLAGVVAVALTRRTLAQSSWLQRLAGQLDAVLPRRNTPTQTLTAPNHRGVQIHHTSWGSGGKGKLPLVFAADGPVTIAAFEAMFIKNPAATALDRRIYMFEPVGQGRSVAAAGSGIKCTLGELAGDVIELLRGWGHQQYVLCFSCSNALVAIEVARLAPELVAAVVGIQCGAPEPQLAWAERLDRNCVIRTPVVGQLLNYLAARSLAQQWWSVAVPAGPTRDTVAAIVDGDIKEGGHFCLASLMQQYARDESAVRRLRCAVPLLAVFGTMDTSHRRTPPDSLLSIADGPAEHEVFESCGHLPEMEDPARFCRVLTAFLLKHRVDPDCC
eukprot:m.462342 g.462342  ORF g.462342 m.462342 type:complete len:340 (+) comp22606_c0_seq1:280-1299(+)